MINLLLGAPGGGKSYEAVAFHILPALQLGRKVITNLPLNIEAFSAIDPSFALLIEIRDGLSKSVQRLTTEPVASTKMFSHVDDYADDWRHPEKEFGPLFVIDECHFALPDKLTSRAVEEWYSMHRHYNVDVLLITQSYGKISASIRDLVQTVYRVRKNVAFGSTSSYVRKVQDGIKGEVVNTSIRRYEKRFYKLYRSHTQGKAVDEFGASDIVPLWRHWSFIGAAVCLVAFLALVFTGNFHIPGTAKSASPPSHLDTLRAIAAARVASAAASSPLPAVFVPSLVASAVHRDPEPFAQKGLHLSGVFTSKRLTVYVFSISQNGQLVSTVTDSELRAAGYVVRFSSPCIGFVEWQGVARPVICDLPAISMTVAGSVSGTTSASVQSNSKDAKVPPVVSSAPPIPSPAGVVSRETVATSSEPIYHPDAVLIGDNLRSMHSSVSSY